ncbi:MAG TPA: tetratricopeptide repeat protein [Terracidiphilus sp.]|nr:tetratricopeptide repeat protein [Terracidiphilus sp.]
MRSFDRWSIPAISISALFSLAQTPTSAKAQMSCTVTFTCPSTGGACAANLGGQVTTRNAGTFASTADCNTKARNANPNLGGVGISCSCNGGDASVAGSTSAAPVARGHEFDSTINRAIADGITGRISAGNAVGFTVLGVLGNALFAPKAPNIPLQPDPAEEQRRLAVQQLNNSGIYLLKQKNYAGAINEFQKAIAISPSDANILHNLDLAKHQLRDAAFADQTSGALGELLGPAPIELGSSGTSLNLVNLGSDASAVDLHNTTGTTVDATTLKGQLDSVFSNNEHASAVSDPPGAQPQANDIDKLFESPSTPARGAIDDFNARCSGVAQGSSACQQQQTTGQLEAKEKQLDQILNPEERADLKDAVGPTKGASSSGAVPAGGDSQPTGGGSTSFFGSSNSVSAAAAGLDNSAPVPQVAIKNTTDALTSANKSGAAANAAGLSNVPSKVQSGYGFDTPPVAHPTAIPINKSVPQTPGAVELAAHIPAAAQRDPAIQNAIQNSLAYYGNLDGKKIDTQNRLNDIQQQIKNGTGDAQYLARQQQTLETNLNQYNAAESTTKSQINDILVKNNYKVNWDEAPTPVTANPSQSTNGTVNTGGSTPQ